MKVGCSVFAPHDRKTKRGNTLLAWARWAWKDRPQITDSTAYISLTQRAHWKPDGPVGSEWLGAPETKCQVYTATVCPVGCLQLVHGQSGIECSGAQSLLRDRSLRGGATSSVGAVRVQWCKYIYVPSYWTARNHMSAPCPPAPRDPIDCPLSPQISPCTYRL